LEAAGVKRTIFCIAIGALGAAPAPVWLDSQMPANWNVPGTPLPAAPGPTDPDLAPDGRCASMLRAPTAPEDVALAHKGWSLIGPYQRYGRTSVVMATAGADGMCRPDRYQGFVFVDAVFAGTLSPQLMNARSDAGVAGVSVNLYGEDELGVTFTRYSASDALCCPHASTSVSYAIRTLGERSIVEPTSAQTSKNAT
jgi:hypothetical protein